MAASSTRILARLLGKLLGGRGRGAFASFHSVAGRPRPRRRCLPFRRFYSDNIVTSTYPKVEIPKMLLHEFIFQDIGRWEEKVAVSCSATGKTLKYRDLWRHSKSLAAALQKKFGLAKGDRQAVLLPNCPEYPVIILAGSMSGVVSTTFNPAYTPDEIAFQLKETQPKLVYTVPDLYEKCSKALGIVSMKIPIVVAKPLPDAEVPTGAVALQELTGTSDSVDFSPVNVDLGDDLVLPFSSGTSGLPKGVQLTHKNIVSNITQYNSGNYLKSNPSTDTNQNIILGVLPMFHIYGMVIVTLDCLRAGGLLVSLPRFEPKSFVDAIFIKKAQILYVAPPLVFFIASSPMVEPRHLQNAQHMVSGAAPCGKADIDKLLAKAPNLDFCQGYGMTETSPVVTFSHSERFHKVASTGHTAVHTQIKVADLANGKALPYGNRGEIRVKGPQVMKGYFNRPEDTKNTFDEDGWLKTGDVGYYDEEGDFFVVDRIKELIKVKGFQVAPAELEEVLRHHPKVADAGVIGVDHPEEGQVPRAFVVLKAGASASEREIQDYIRDRLSSYKQLKGGVRFIDEIPKSSAGKILRKELKLLNGDS